MSRVYWHSPTRDVELSGRERRNAGAIVNGVALSFLPRSDFDSSDLKMWDVMRLVREAGRTVTTHA